MTHGSLWAARRGPLPARRLRPDGTLDHQAWTEDLLLEVTVDGGQVERGRHLTEILLDGKPRLQVVYSVGVDQGHIESVTSVGARPLPRGWQP